VKAILVYTADWYSTCFRIGYFPLAPGTLGSLIALIAWIFLPETSIINLIIIISIIFIIGIFSTGLLEKEYNIQDPSYIIIDEWVGMWVALLFVPNDTIWFAFAFILFRSFDILKIYPANIIEKLNGGMGIMLDDIVAGLYSGLITSGIARII
jgi:phosphatidylglycerophosphatase A|tara:strand:- start:563 stop:1021 length:459 start_codon:yes stop_codon:yes gene_type:complete